MTTPRFMARFVFVFNDWSWALALNCLIQFMFYDCGLWSYNFTFFKLRIWLFSATIYKTWHTFAGHIVRQTLDLYHCTLFFLQNKTLCFVHFPMAGNSQADKKRDKCLRPAYLYDTNLRFHTIIIYWDPGLLHHPLLDGICDVGYHWEQIYRIKVI